MPSASSKCWKQQALEAGARGCVGAGCSGQAPWRGRGPTPGLRALGVSLIPTEKSPTWHLLQSQDSGVALTTGI